MEKYDVLIQCYGSIGSGHWTMQEDRYKDVKVLEDPVIKEIATAKGKSPAQITIAWHVQRGTIPLAKTAKEERLLENISAAYDVNLTEDEVKKIDALDNNVRLYNPKFISGFGWNGTPYFD